MGADVEVAIVRACCKSPDGQELYWLFSRSQLEFVLHELDLVDSSKTTMMVRYQDLVLPVLFLEKHFGYKSYTSPKKPKYMVLRGVAEGKKMRKVIVPTGYSPKFFKLTKTFAALTVFSTPENSEHVLGAYSLGDNKIGIVPDFIGSCEVSV